jgi:hypothetical protein
MNLDAMSTPDYATVLNILNARTEEVRCGSDVVTPVEALIRAGIIPQISGDYRIGEDTTSRVIVVPHRLSFPSSQGWRRSAMERLAEYRSYGDDWDGQSGEAPAPEALDTAEVLVGFFSAFPSNRRPVVSLDAFGAPSFFLERDNLYFHLTVDVEDGICTLSWLGEKGGQDLSDEGVDFDGSVLPQKIRDLLSA